MGSPIPGSMAMPDVPEHFPMPVDAWGNGPTDPGETHGVQCACGNPDCRAFMRNELDASIAFRMLESALEAWTRCGAVYPDREGQAPCRKSAGHAVTAPETDWKRMEHSNGLLKWRVDGADLAPVSHVGGECTIRCFLPDGTKRPHA